MGSLSIWHWLIVLIYLFIFIVPAWRIASKAGFSGAWSLLMIVPLVNLILIWIFAFVRWPAVRDQA